MKLFQGKAKDAYESRVVVYSVHCVDSVSWIQHAIRCNTWTYVPDADRPREIACLIVIHHVRVRVCMSKKLSANSVLVSKRNSKNTKVRIFRECN